MMKNTSDSPHKCLTCWWWGLRDSASVPEANRQCHRFPPIAVRNADGEIESCFPWTNQHDYCGEHKPTVSRNKIDQPPYDDLVNAAYTMNSLADGHCSFGSVSKEAAEARRRVANWLLSIANDR